MLRNALATIVLLAGLLAARPATAELRVVACEPEWGALASELGGDLVSVYTATTGKQDPHRVEARPSLIARVRRADLLVCSGAELELGWLPVLLRQASNARVQPGTKGYFLASDQVTRLEIPSVVDRSQGDIHVSGNPHIQCDPHRIATVAQALSERMAELDPAEAAQYRARYAAFATRWRLSIERWEREAAPLRGVPIAVQHRSWIYLEEWLGLVEVAALEPKPGIPPTSGHLAEVLARLQSQPVRLVIRAAYEDARPSEWLAERAGIPAVMLPFTVGGSDAATDLEAMFDDTLRRLLGALE